jgi:hypothetical protein
MDPWVAQLRASTVTGDVRTMEHMLEPSPVAALTSHSVTGNTLLAWAVYGSSPTTIQFVLGLGLAVNVMGSFDAAGLVDQPDTAFDCVMALAARENRAMVELLLPLLHEPFATFKTGAYLFETAATRPETSALLLDALFGAMTPDTAVRLCASETFTTANPTLLRIIREGTATTVQRLLALGARVFTGAFADYAYLAAAKRRALYRQAGQNDASGMLDLLLAQPWPTHSEELAAEGEASLLLGVGDFLDPAIVSRMVDMGALPTRRLVDVLVAAIKAHNDPLALAVAHMPGVDLSVCVPQTRAASEEDTGDGPFMWPLGALAGYFRCPETAAFIAMASQAQNARWNDLRALFVGQVTRAGLDEAGTGESKGDD